MSKSLKAIHWIDDQILVASSRVAAIGKNKPGLGTISAIALLQKRGKYDGGAGKASGASYKRAPSPSCQRRNLHLTDNQAARAEYIRLGIIKPVSSE
jgi:hypothetical protein